MKVSAFFAILLCKLLRFVARVLHRGGTAMPGRWALKVCPDLLKILVKDVNTVVVTGTNGKTTSARMVEQALSDAGLAYFANRSGANLISGITTEFVMNCTLGGKMKKNYSVIECDEAAAVKVFPTLNPKVVLVTNLFSDQVDRFGDVTNTLAAVRKAVQGVPDSVLCLNADCSLTASLAWDVPNKVVRYGMCVASAGEGQAPADSDAARCLKCGAPYEYDFVTYDHLGGFRCPECGWSWIAPDFRVEEIISTDASRSIVRMVMDGEEREVAINLPALYNIYNAAGACAAIVSLGLSRDDAVRAMAGFKCGFGRMEQFDSLGAQGTRMMLVKNAAGCNQVIDFLCTVSGEFVLALCVNNRVADGTDISWLAQAKFEKLAPLCGSIAAVAVSGMCMEDIRSRLIEAGIPEEKIHSEPDVEEFIDWVGEQTLPVFLMPTYTGMLETREVIVKHCGGKDFWEG